KMVGSAALRLGFAVANKTITSALRAVKSPYNVNSVSQAIGEIVYGNKDFLLKRQKTIVKNTKKLYNGLADISKTVGGFEPVEPLANFVYVKAERGKEIFEFLKSKSIVIRIMGGYLRISAGTEEEIDELLCGIKEFFEKG
ncbi:MAG: aminotransferase class I/II-fold pyridoxal phosphate-dependent enzyme, partial [Ruminococcus sp.]|nr:aminotransferase class I/II-fold pyridoxal phosphate-dependent enzyme [Ruminococcus sp.]